MAWEYEFLSWVQEHHVEALNPVMKFLSFLGDSAWFWITLTLILIIVKQTRTIGIEAALAMILTLLVGNLLLKNLFDRVRPYDAYQTLIPLAVRPHDASFPSGHTMQSFAPATVIFLNNRKWGTAALVLAFLIAVSRVYNVMHYPTDVIAGMVVGVAAGICAYTIVTRYQAKHRA